MNPLDWKREHQVALAVAAAIGVVGGLMVAYFMPRLGMSSSSPISYDGTISFLFFRPYITVLGWAFLGAILGSAVVYVCQLLKA
jgi:hypothetical protein